MTTTKKNTEPELAPATISEHDGVRYLHLGTPWVQGAMRIARPQAIELEYVQRMLAWMLWRPAAELSHGHAVQLGLGAGTLTRFCHQRLRMQRTTAVEINPSVIAACRQWFRLPADVAPAGSHFVPGPGDETAMRAFLTARAERERATRGARGYNKRRLDDFQGSLVRGDLLQASADGFGARGRNLNLATQVTLAADVIEQGISRAVQIDTRLGFDTHNNNEQQNDFHNTVFGVLGDLCTDLQGRAGAGAGATLFDETIVVVMSEMSRTPKINGQMGKDHWPVTSALVIGGGAGNGRVLGGTTNKLEARAIDLATGTSIADGPSLQTNNLVAGVLSMAGADPEPWMPGITPLGGFGA